MEKNPSGSNVSTTMSAIDHPLGIPSFYAKWFSNPKQTQTSQVEMIYIEEITNMLELCASISQAETSERAKSV